MTADTEVDNDRADRLRLLEAREDEVGIDLRRALVRGRQEVLKEGAATESYRRISLEEGLALLSSAA